METGGRLWRVGWLPLLLALAVLSSRSTAQDLAFDESRFLDLSLKDGVATESQPAPQLRPAATLRAADLPRQNAPPVQNPDHIDLPAVPPPPSAFSFRELMSLAGHPRFYTGSSSESSSAEQSDPLIQELVANMKWLAAVDDPEHDTKLYEALQEIKNQIVYKANSIRDEKKWVDSLAIVLGAYYKKVRRVNEHVKKLVREALILFKKKKQIENMIIQRKLEKQLKLTRMDLEVIHAALQNVMQKDVTFTQNTKDVKSTIGLMEDTLKQIRSGTRKEEKQIMKRMIQGKSIQDSQEESSKECVTPGC